MNPYACLVSLALLHPLSLNAQSTEEVSLSFLTYNVAGLPEPISASSPAKNSSKIGQLINNYDVALLQEDFNYHNKLAENALHPYQSKTSGWAVFGDGLNSFSNVPFRELERIKWKDCHGFITDGADCMTPKGIMFGRYEIASGILVDVYNLHADAGSDEKSMEARRKNISQLLHIIAEKSHDRPVIVVGDFNSRYTRTGDSVELMLEAGFEDSWMIANDLASPPAKGSSVTESCATDVAGPGCELIDKIYFRGSQDLMISLIDYQVPSAIFQNDSGDPLSDHNPVEARLRFTWKVD